MLIPGTISDLKFDESVRRASVTHFDQGTDAIFHLRFNDRVEFWEFSSTVAHLRSEEQARNADLAHKLSLIRHFVPSHGPDGLMDVICTNEDHAQGYDHSSG
ncbi:hypothetical protein GSI_01195 [Ganoderma sinense ZZ0214-1]|uniref:Uncharacterized protein n=1 Tax=Ganoderma sinense ZZ0214-1 TaxID=1077348 RepID=A0A2G8SUP8_9APHY|nr:hypothetical protein GSI_01195 [Ganoderma sinense ZZ0214-1]